MDSHNHLFSYVQDDDLSLAQFQSNSVVSSLFHLPLPIEAKAKLDDIMPVVNSITLDHLDVEEWMLCGGDEQYKPKKFYIFLF